MKSKEFLKSLAEYAAQLRQTIEAEADGFDASPATIAERRAKVLDPVHGYEYFVNTYFPHYVRSSEKSELHEFLFSRLPEILQQPEGINEADAAPRGEAKSTLVTRLFSLWTVITGAKKFIVIAMDSIDQAYPMLEAIKAELEFNPRLKTDFPEMCGQGRVWQAGTIVTASNVKIQVFSSGKKMRGMVHGAFRPDLAILDDIENDEMVRNPDQRDKLEMWLKQTVLPLGAVGTKFDVIYIGTILHYDSVLSRTLNNPFWSTRKFKAMKRWPDRMDLWDRWEELYRNDGAVLDKLLSEQRQKFNGAQVRGWVVYCGAEFLSALKEHKSIFEVYKRFDEARAYREGDTLNPTEFIHKGIRFIEYANHFGSDADIGADKAILLPVGRNLYKEYFAPADMNATVNTRALPYYASREKLQHDKGWSLHMQSNPLPIALRPELLATLTMS